MSWIPPEKLSSAEHMHELMHRQGIKPQLSPELLSATLDLYEDGALRKLSWVEASAFFRTHAVLVPQGLETLPLPWLQQLPIRLWHTRKPHWDLLPYLLKSVAIEAGVLRLYFPQELIIEEDRLSLWDRLRVTLNLSMRPNLWLPLNPSEEREIWNRHPELRNELFTVRS
jgi:hypothetical protein